jgi:hypothetical protein
MTWTGIPERRARKAANVATLRALADSLNVEVGQVWEHAGTRSLIDLDRRFESTGPHIRIVQVAGEGGPRTTRFVKVNPPRGGNGRPDRQSHPIDRWTLARAYTLVRPGAGADAEVIGHSPAPRT